MFTPAAPLPLDLFQKRVLESLGRSGRTPQVVARKCKVILLASAESRAFAAGTDARVGAEDPRYNFENQAAGCNALERSYSGSTSRSHANTGAWGLAALCLATSSGGEVQAVQRSEI